MWIIFPGNVLYALFCPEGIRYDPAGKKRDAPGLYRAGAAGSAMAVRQNGRLADLYVPISTEGMQPIIKAVCKSPADAAVCGYIAIAVRIISAYGYVCQAVCQTDIEQRAACICTGSIVHFVLRGEEIPFTQLLGWRKTIRQRLV